MSSGIDVRAHDADRRVTAAVDPQERQGDRTCPRERSTRAVDLGCLTEMVEVVAEPGQDPTHGGEVDDPTGVVDVVADARCEEVEPADGADHLAERR